MEVKAVDTAAIDLESGRHRWALVPLRPDDPPQVSAASLDQSTGTDSLIEFSVLAELREVRFPPSKAADRPTPIHRSDLDLIGVLPAPGEVEAFVRDSSSALSCHLVDQLCASFHYPDPWGRPWLDATRPLSFGHGGDHGCHLLHDEATTYPDCDRLGRHLPGASGQKLRRMRRSVAGLSRGSSWDPLAGEPPQGPVPSWLGPPVVPSAPADADALPDPRTRDRSGPPEAPTSVPPIAIQALVRWGRRYSTR